MNRLLIFVTSLFAGCAQLMDKYEYDVEDLPLSFICTEVRSYTALSKYNPEYEEARDEYTQALKCRHSFSAAEWRAIFDQEQFIGMSEPALVCAKGNPYDILEFASDKQSYKEYVYASEFNVTSRLHIRLERGKVVSWQHLQDL